MAGLGTYDAEGWTDLVPSGDSRMIYVSAIGDNAYNGLHPVWTSGTNGPKRTIRPYFQGAVSNAVTSPTTTLIPSADAQKSSNYVGLQLYFTSGALNGLNYTISSYSVVSGEVRLVMPTMAGTPANGDTFYVTGADGAFALMRTGYPDWLCLRCGDSFKEDVGTGGITWEISGRSITEPAVLTSYRMDGATIIYQEGTRPKLDRTGIFYYNFTSDPGISHLAFTNIESVGYGTTSGNGFQWSGRMKNILIEGWLLRDWNVIGDFAAGNKFAPAGMDEVTNFIFRRNVCYDGVGMGVMFSNHNQLLLEDNFFDRNGVLGGTHNTLHNVYTQKIRNLICRNNIFARGSNFGIKMSADYIAGNSHGDYTDYLVENNLFYNNGISNDWSGRLAAPPLIKSAIQDNTSASITPTTVNFVGSVVSGTRASTVSTNGTFHQIDDASNVIDIVYGWDMWFDSTVSPDQWLDEGRIASGVIIACYLQGSGDEMKIKVWNFTTDSWDTIGTITGAGTTDVVTQTLSLTSHHTGPDGDAHEGKVYVRLATDSTTPSTLAIDRLVLTADPAYTHKDGVIKDNVMTMAGRTWSVTTAEYHPEVNAGQDLQGWLLSGDTIDWDGNLLIHMPTRAINAQPLAWSSNQTNVTVRNTVIYNWKHYLDVGAYEPDELDYLNLNRVAGITVSDTELTLPGDTDTYGYLDPTRSLAKYNEDVIGATVSDDSEIEDDYAIDFLMTARSQLSRSNWNTAYTAAPINTWIRAGFNIVDHNPTTFGGQTSGTCDENADYVTGTLTAVDAVDGMTTPNFTVISPASHGEGSINPTTGAWSYTPDTDFFGSDNFLVRVTDDLGNHDTQIITITVNEVGGSPTTYLITAGGFTYVLQTGP